MREKTPIGGHRLVDAEYNKLVYERIVAQTLPNERGCWVWQGRKLQSRRSRSWYGQMNYRSKTVTVHRVMISITQRPAGFREVVMHECDNSLCANPAHLKFGTTQANLKDAAAKGSYQYHKSHYHACKHGHEFTPENTWVCKRGFRHCRECQRLRNKRPEVKQRMRETQRLRRARERATQCGDWERPDRHHLGTTIEERAAPKCLVVDCPDPTANGQAFCEEHMKRIDL